MKTSIDPLTKEVFLKKRISQRFANSVNRITYHNKKANIVRQEMMFVNRPLFVNNKILMELMRGKVKSFFHKEFLLGKGFTFGVFTNYSVREEKQYPTVYNFLLIPISEEKIQIIKLQPND